MPFKDKNKRNEYLREWRKKNPTRTRELALMGNKFKQKRNREFLWKIKSETPCADCGKKFHPVAMDFDHIEEKKFEIATMAHNCHSIESIRIEIEKCEIVCAVCHRIRTHNRMSYSSKGRTGSFQEPEKGSVPL